MMTNYPVVLLIDASADDRELYTVGLELEGFRVVTASSSEQALAADPSRRADIVVLHLGTAGWKRYEMLRQALDAPIVILTARIRPDRANRKRAAALNVAAFAAKPCTPSSLAEVLRRVLRGGTEPPG